jgi:hypothetical protein
MADTILEGKNSAIEAVAKMASEEESSEEKTEK